MAGHLKLTLLMHKRFGPVYKVWLGPSPSVHITRPEDVEVSDDVNQLPT